jgi:pilus assembly protein Flp/PilA
MLRVWVALHGGWGHDADGASMLEYALLIALIAMVVIGAALFFGTELSSDFSEVGDTMQAS